MEMAFGALGGL